MPVRQSDYFRNQLATAINDLMSGDNGPSVLKVYSGARPSAVGDGVGESVLLADFTFNPTAFTETAEAGELQVPSRLFDDNTGATGTPGWGLIEDGSGNKLIDFLCPADLNVPGIVVGGTATISTLVLTVAAGTETGFGDINLDGKVNALDLNIILDNWGYPDNQ